jgi:hypothetical protein
MSWEKCVEKDLQALGQPTNMHDLKRVCALRGPWRSMLYKLTHPHSSGVSYRRPHNIPRPTSTMHLRQHADTLPFQAAWSSHAPRALSD